MKKAANMSELFDKLNDLKSVFRYGEKLIPIIQSIIEFMKETVPLLENINTSIAESTSKIPKATNQILNVTNATEIATTEILDLIDEISNNLGKAGSISKQISDEYIVRRKIWDKIKLTLNDEILIKEYEDADNDLLNSENQSGIFNKIQEELYRITLSLQVQDITAQQLASVNHLIESVHNKLSLLITDFQHAELKDVDNTDMPAVEGATFDPNARYHDKTEQQEVVDALVNTLYEKTSQAEIDKLFS
jgi:chemotaxis regulatin CheY-phosphate phosphatase CheZ